MRKDTDDFFRWMTGVDARKRGFTQCIFTVNEYHYGEWYWRNLFTHGLKDDEVIMQTWPGHFHGDTFVFTIGELRKYVKENNII